MARDFNGSSDYLEFTLALSYPFTAACWFWANNVTTLYTMLAANNFSGSDNDIIRMEAAGSAGGDPVRCVGVSNGGGTTTALTSTGYTANSWFHACMVCTSQTLRDVYINGGSAGTNTTSRSMTGLDRLTIGAHRNAGTLAAFLAGRVAEVGVWNIALSPAEVALAATGLQPDQVRPEAVRFYAPLVRDVFDYHGAALSASSGTTVADHPRIFR